MSSIITIKDIVINTGADQDLIDKLDGTIVLAAMFGYKVIPDHLFGNWYVSMSKSEDEGFAFRWSKNDLSDIKLLVVDPDPEWGGYDEVRIPKDVTMFEHFNTLIN
jgi:hypothetical protein